MNIDEFFKGIKGKKFKGSIIYTNADVFTPISIKRNHYFGLGAVEDVIQVKHQAYPLKGGKPYYTSVIVFTPEQFNKTFEQLK